MNRKTVSYPPGSGSGGGCSASPSLPTGFGGFGFGRFGSSLPGGVFGITLLLRLPSLISVPFDHVEDSALRFHHGADHL